MPLRLSGGPSSYRTLRTILPDVWVARGEERATSTRQSLIKCLQAAGLIVVNLSPLDIRNAGGAGAAQAAPASTVGTDLPNRPARKEPCCAPRKGGIRSRASCAKDMKSRTPTMAPDGAQPGCYTLYLEVSVTTLSGASAAANSDTNQNAAGASLASIRRVIGQDFPGGPLSGRAQGRGGRLALAGPRLAGPGPRLPRRRLPRPGDRRRALCVAGRTYRAAPVAAPRRQSAPPERAAVGPVQRGRHERRARLVSPPRRPDSLYQQIISVAGDLKCFVCVESRQRHHGVPLPPRTTAAVFARRAARNLIILVSAIHDPLSVQ